MNFEISKNICEICRQKATAGILDETQQIKIRYSCQDHYLQVYKKIKDQRKKEMNNYKIVYKITESSRSIQKKTQLIEIYLTIQSK